MGTTRVAALSRKTMCRFVIVKPSISMDRSARWRATRAPVRGAESPQKIDRGRPGGEVVGPLGAGGDQRVHHGRDGHGNARKSQTAQG